VDTPVEASSVRPLISGMRAMFVVSCVTVSLAGFQLCVLTEYTHRFFAWTIDVPLTAAFLGASYWGSFALVLVASRQQAWARARVAVPSVWLFTVLTLLATLIHIDLFRMDSVFGWAWLVVYLVVPLGYGVFSVRQLRIAGGDPPRQASLPRWLRFVLGIQAAIMLIWGTALFLVPQTMATLWPWALTPLTGQAVGAWLIGVASLRPICVGRTTSGASTRGWPVMLRWVYSSCSRWHAMVVEPWTGAERVDGYTCSSYSAS
jgi:hypothetical protein